MQTLKVALYSGHMFLVIPLSFCDVSCFVNCGYSVHDVPWLTAHVSDGK